MNKEALKMALEALEANRRTHYYCEDTWYSCPKHEDGCANEAEGNECNCGADKANAEIDYVTTAIKAALAQPAQDRCPHGVWIADYCYKCNQPQPAQEPVAWTTMPEAEDWCFVSGNKDPNGKLKGKWFPLYTTSPQPAQEPYGYDWSMLEAAQESLREHMARIKELEAALAQPAQEPVAWTLLLTGKDTGMVGAAGEKFIGAPDYYQRVNVYTEPPQREWNAALDEAASRIGEIKGFGKATQDSFAVYIKGLKK